jgi:hypothetical protein
MPSFPVTDSGAGTIPNPVAIRSASEPVTAPRTGPDIRLPAI